MARLEIGDTAPAFSLLDQDENKVALKDFRDDRVILYFYPADDTPGCTKEACQFNDEFSPFVKKISSRRPQKLLWFFPPQKLICYRTFRKIIFS